MQTLRIEADTESSPGVYHMAVQPATGLLLLAHSRRKSVLALHLTGAPPPLFTSGP